MQTAVVFDPSCVRVTVPGVPETIAVPVHVEGVPPVVATLRAMYGVADRYQPMVTLSFRKESPHTVKS